jgi:REP element-mobilizing transposase RayT
MFNLPAPPDFRGLDENLPLRVYYRHLPHWRQDGATYFVTFRLDDALPQAKIRELQEMREKWEVENPEPRSKEVWEAFARDVTVKSERWMDEGYGACFFKSSRLAKLLSDALLHFNRQRYFIPCFVIMPNHCHLVIRPFEGHDLERILQVCKGYVAREINRAIGARRTVWQQESFDRIIRDEEHLYRVIQYIGMNPSRAGIAKENWFRWIDPVWQAAGWQFADG